MSEMKRDHLSMFNCHETHPASGEILLYNGNVCVLVAVEQAIVEQPELRPNRRRPRHLVQYDVCHLVMKVNSRCQQVITQ